MTEADKDREFLNAGEGASLLRTFARELRRIGSAKEADGFDQIAAELESGVNDELRTARLEEYKSQLAAWEARVKYNFDWQLESFRSTMSLAQRAITSAMVVNGGAAVALLAYMGNVKAAAEHFATPLLLFSGGVLLAAVTFGFSYWTQLRYTDNTVEAKKRGDNLRWKTVVLAALAFLAFIGGIMTSNSGFDAAAKAAAAAAKAVLETKPANLVEERRNMSGPTGAGPAPRYEITRPIAPAEKPAEPTQSTTEPAAPPKAPGT